MAAAMCGVENLDPDAFWIFGQGIPARLYSLRSVAIWGFARSEEGFNDRSVRSAHRALGGTPLFGIKITQPEHYLQVLFFWSQSSPLEPGVILGPEADQERHLDQEIGSEDRQAPAAREEPREECEGAGGGEGVAEDHSFTAWRDGKRSRSQQSQSF